MLKDTRILFAGWSWKQQKFVTGFYVFFDGLFHYQTVNSRLGRPWRERHASLIVIGDYIEDYMRKLNDIISLTNTPARPWGRTDIDLQYEPLEALAALLEESRDLDTRPSIGGAPQMLKLYSYSSTLPTVIRSPDGEHFLFGRRLFPWEKTELPIAIVRPGKTQFEYPMAHIPLPIDVTTDGTPKPIRKIFSQLIRFFTSRGDG